jgi:hypothetical protein
MTRFIAAVFVAALVSAVGSPAGAADDKDAVLDKAIKALGGQEKLSAIKAMTWKSKGTLNFGGMDNPFTSEATMQGLDHLRQEFEGEFMGNKIKGITVINGDKGWRKFADMSMELEKNAVADQKRLSYLLAIPATLVPLREKGFKIEVAGEEKVGDKPAVALKVTPPDGKDFKLYFDKESGLPVKEVAKVTGFMGDEFMQETTFDGYKDMNGIKKATKVTYKRDGQKFMDFEITDFKILDRVDPKKFAAPE